MSGLGGMFCWAPLLDALDRGRDAVVSWRLGQEGRFRPWLAVCAMGGDAAYFGLSGEPPGWVGPVVVGLGLALVLVRRGRVRREPTLAAGLAIVFLGIGFGAAQLASARATPFAALPARAVVLTGRIVQTETLPEGQRVVLEQVTADAVPIGTRRLRMRVPAAILVPGEIVRLRGMVRPPDPPAYPGGRDLQRDAWFSNLAGYGYALGPVEVRVPAQGSPLAALRRRIAVRVQTVLPGPRGAIAAALLTGLSAAIPAEDRAAFRDAGLAHLLAIAGLHIGIVMALALLVVRTGLTLFERPALFWPIRQIAAGASLAAGLAYLLLTGGHVPILRSFVMASLVVLAVLAGRRPLSLHGWAIACAAVVLVQPEEITGPSFQLSFAAVLALIAGHEAMRGRLGALRAGGRTARAGYWLAALALTSLLAGTASMPFIAYHFGRIQLYFLVANMLAVPLTALWIMPAGLLALVLMPVGLDRLVLPVMGWGVDLVLWIAREVAAWPAATIAIGHMGIGALLPMAAGLAWLCLWRGRSRLLGLVPIVAGGLAVIVGRPPDLLVSADGGALGVIGPRALYVRQTRETASYAVAQWSQYAGLPVSPMASAPASIAQCAGGVCRVRRRGASLMFGAGDIACPGAGLIVVPDGAAPYCRGVGELDRDDEWHQGAWVVRLADGDGRVSDRDVRGRRPWVFLPPEQARAAANLPFAPSILLPSTPRKWL